MTAQQFSFTFEPATKAQSKARVALAGPSGSGKTWTGLLLAQHLGETTAVIDTERGSASKYAGPFTFQRLNMQRYDPRDLPKALSAAAAAGFDTVIVDSLSKFWAGQGGMLEQVDNAAKRGFGGNSFGGWKEARPMETAMIEALLSYPGHVIVTMRTKTAYEIIEDDRGRKVPTKIGLKPEQRDGIEYEFDIVGDMDLENTLTVSKSRCPALSGEVIRRPGADLAQQILAWLTDGESVLSAMDYRDQALAAGLTFAGAKDLYRTVEKAGLLGASVPDDRGEPVPLSQLIISQGKSAEAREVFGGRSPSAQDLRAEAGDARDALTEGPIPADLRDPDDAARALASREAPGSPVRAARAEAAGPPAEGDEDVSWVADWSARLANAGDESALSALRREIGPAIGSGKIQPATANELSDAIDRRRGEIRKAAA